MTDATPDHTQDIRPIRARRVLAAVIDGAAIESIGAQEQLPTDKVEAIVREELGRRWVAPIADFAKIQIARLEHLYLLVMDAILRGEVAAIDRALRIFDRLDRYHGFNRASPAIEPYGEEERERLIAKLNEVAERLSDEPDARG